ncbi:hypothetical protein GF361_04505 [Candidatus Woesearchaeota archaeon]|nr:hypothetical protein [Candidatus Woesearchaeota archaeon]
MDEKEVKKRIERIEYISKQLLAAFKLNNETYIRRRLRQLIALNGRLYSKAISGKAGLEICNITDAIGAEISKIQENLDNPEECMKYVGVILELIGKKEKIEIDFQIETIKDVEDLIDLFKKLDSNKEYLEFKNKSLQEKAANRHFKYNQIYEKNITYLSMIDVFWNYLIKSYSRRREGQFILYALEEELANKTMFIFNVMESLNMSYEKISDFENILFKLWFNELSKCKFIEIGARGRGISRPYLFSDKLSSMPYVEEGYEWTSLENPAYKYNFYDLVYTNGLLDGGSGVEYSTEKNPNDDLFGVFKTFLNFGNMVKKEGVMVHRGSYVWGFARNKDFLDEIGFELLFKEKDFWNKRYDIFGFFYLFKKKNNKIVSLKEARELYLKYFKR